MFRFSQSILLFGARVYELVGWLVIRLVCWLGIKLVNYIFGWLAILVKKKIFGRLADWYISMMITWAFVV